ncbi:MAG: hypothetical protein K2Q34_06825 [Alphaproteobacteria bacterium]|nr:hypothetical protein [Alphaproteobacteria bacterium]
MRLKVFKRTISRKFTLEIDNLKIIPLNPPKRAVQRRKQLFGMNPPDALLGMFYNALMRFLAISSGKARKVKADLFQREGFLRFLAIFFAPRKVLINGVPKVPLCFLDRFSLEDDEIVGISDPTVKHAFCFIELKMASKSFIFDHNL